MLEFASAPPTYHQTSGSFTWTSSTPLVAPASAQTARPFLVPFSGATTNDGMVAVRVYCDFYDSYYHVWHTDEVCGGGLPVEYDLVAGGQPAKWSPAVTWSVQGDGYSGRAAGVTKIVMEVSSWGGATLSTWYPAGRPLS